MPKPLLAQIENGKKRAGVVLICGSGRLSLRVRLSNCIARSIGGLEMQHRAERGARNTLLATHSASHFERRTAAEADRRVDGAHRHPDDDRPKDEATRMTRILLFNFQFSIFNSPE